MVIWMFIWHTLCSAVVLLVVQPIKTSLNIREYGSMQHVTDKFNDTVNKDNNDAKKDT